MPDEFDVDVEALANGDDTPAQAAPAEPAEEAPAAPAPSGRPSRFMSARKPDLLQRVGGKVAAPLARVRLPEWNLRTFAYLLLLLLLVWFLLENWTPARFSLLLWSVEAPKTILFVLNLVLGAVLLRWWQVFTASRAARATAGPEEPEEPELEESEFDESA